MPSKLELLRKREEYRRKIAQRKVEQPTQPEQPVEKEPKKKGGKKPIRKFLVVDAEVDHPKEPVEENKEELSVEEIPVETEE